MSDKMTIIIDNPYPKHWYAYDDDLYDVDCVEGHYVVSGQGSGRTKWEALRDLIDTLEEAELEEQYVIEQTEDGRWNWWGEKSEGD